LVVLEGEKNIDQERWRFLSWLAGHCNEAIRAAYWQTGQLLGVGADRGRKMIGRNRVNLIVGWCGRFLFFVVPRQFSQDISEWPENQILIPDWTNFHCPGTTQNLFYWPRVGKNGTF